MLPALIGGLVPVLGRVLDRVLPDSEARAKAESELAAAMLAHAGEIERAAGDIVKAEAQGESWLQRNWRPLTMLSFLGLLFLYWFGIQPENLSDAVLLKVLDLLQIGIGGYIMSRGAEKGIKLWKNGP